PQQAISPPIPEIIHIPISCQISHEALDHHLIPILHPVILDQTSDQIFMVTDAACLSKAINPMQSHAPCSTVTDERNEDKIQRQEIVRGLQAGAQKEQGLHHLRSQSKA
ncbi:hypothetical protein PMZ80_004798, partial [Knufia obscura]